MTFKEYAREVLNLSDIPLTPQEIWDIGVKEGLNEKLNTQGATPWRTIGAQLFVDTRDNIDTVFIRVGKRPVRFFLKDKQNNLSTNIIQQIEDTEEKEEKKKKKAPFNERKLHPLLAYFVNTNASFNRGKSVYTRTVYHEKSEKKGLKQWLHPDMVGFYLPVNDWNTELLDFNKIIDNNSLKLFSFELKIKITKSSYREDFFQAVSNSSWAHEGYLVTSEIYNDDELFAELERLSIAFGIGIIQLNLTDIDSSSVIFQARKKDSLDWEGMNKLSDINPDFKEFLQDIKIDFDSKRIHPTGYDKILQDPYTYIEKELLLR